MATLLSCQLPNAFYVPPCGDSMSTSKLSSSALKKTGKCATHDHFCEKSTSHPSETAGKDGQDVSSKSSHNHNAGQGSSKVSVAMETVLGMDIPKEVAQLAVDIHYLHHHEDFPNAQQLYLAALDIMNDPSKQERYTRELALAREKQPAEETRNAHNKPIQSDLQEDGCGGIDSGLRLPDEVDNAKEVAAATLEPETGQKPEDVPDTKAKLRQRVQKLEKENHKLQHRKLCRMCRKVELATSGITFLPCGHFITCEDCAEKCDDCPACGKNIMGTVRTFLS